MKDHCLVASQSLEMFCLQYSPYQILNLPVATDRGLAVMVFVQQLLSSLILKKLSLFQIIYIYIYKVE